MSRRVVREGEGEEEGKEGEGGEARRGAPRWRREERRDPWRPTKKTRSEVGVLRSGKIFFYRALYVSGGLILERLSRNQTAKEILNL